MSGISGWPSSKKSSHAFNKTNNFATVKPTDPYSHGLEVPKFAFRLGGIRTAEAGTEERSFDGKSVFFVKETGTPARYGDFVRFTDGNSEHIEFPIIEVFADGFVISCVPDSKFAPKGGDSFYIMRYVTQRVGEDGSQYVVAQQGPLQFVLDDNPTEVEQSTTTPGDSIPLPVAQLNLDGTVNDPTKKQIAFIRDGAEVLVTEDSVNPANNLPLPVKLSSVTGDVNITAGDLNVQLSDKGANPDITRIGDGVNELGMTADKEALVFDEDTHTLLGTLGNAVAKETTLDAVKTAVEAIAGEDFATESTLASLESKVLTDAQLRANPVNVTGPLTDTELRAAPVEVDLQNTALPLPTGAATETTLQALAGEDFATEATLSSLLAKTPAGGLVPEKYDEISLTYVTSGNGVGEIQTVVYKLASVTIATLTLGYDSSSRLNSVVRS